MTADKRNRFWSSRRSNGSIVGASQLSHRVQMVVEVICVGRAGVSILITVCPRTLVLAMWSY